MGFYIKKSIKFGPLRFNLSNSGIGVSTGVKGLRAGVDSKGRTYVSGGKGILRYRKQLSPKKQDTDNNNAGFLKIISLFLLIALILTALYFIKPDIIDFLLKSVVQNFLRFF